MNDQNSPPFPADDSVSRDSSPASTLRALLERAELSQRGAARLLGIEERTMRMWCAGKGDPPASVFRALNPRLTYTEHLRWRVEQNEQHIRALESGRTHELPRAYQPSNAESAQNEIEHLQRLNEAYLSVVRLDEAFYALQDAHAAIFQQWLEPGFGPDSSAFQTLETADRDFQEAKATFDRVTQRIRRVGIKAYF